MVRRCVPEVDRFPVQIENALKEIDFVLKPSRNAKQQVSARGSFAGAGAPPGQALAAIQELQKILPIDRAQMRVRLETSTKVRRCVVRSALPCCCRPERP